MVSKKEARKQKKFEEASSSTTPKNGDLSSREEEQEGAFEEPAQLSLPSEGVEELALSQPSRFHHDIQTKERQVWLDDITIEYLGQTLLDHAELHLQPGHHYALIGRNGLGKTTLLRYMEARRIQGFPQGLRVLHVRQEVVGDETKVLDCVIEGVPRLAALREQIRRLEEAQGLAEGGGGGGGGGGEELAEAYREIEELRGFDAEERAKKVLQQVGFSEEKIAAQTKELSGGWKMRLAIAQSLFADPDLLLLDEPTNHLDLPSRLWLQQIIRSLPQTIIIVSHDRAFLNAVATDVILLKDKLLRYFQGNYDDFVEILAERVRKHNNQLEWQERQISHIRESVQSARQAGIRSGDDKKLQIAASKEKSIERVGAYRDDSGKRWKYGMRGYKQKVAPLIPDPQFDFTFPPASDILSHGSLIQMREVSYRYSPTQPSFTITDVNLDLPQGIKVGIIGANGAGKSTLLNLLTGTLKPSKGEILRHSNLKIGYYTQHHVDSLNLETTAVEYIRQEAPPAANFSALDARQHLGGYGVCGDVPLQRLKTLSGGQKARVVLASLMLKRPNLLILDEPTNHLDIDTIDALSRVLQEFQGGVLLVSHDELLVKQVCQKVYALKKGVLKEMEGGFEEYRKQVEELERRKALRNAKKS